MSAVPIAELLITHVGIHIPVVWIAYVLLIFGLFTTGRMGEFWKAPLAKPYMFMMLLLPVAAVLGYYPSRSLGVVIPYALRFHIFPIFYCAIALTTKQVRHVLLWLGWGAFLLLLLCFVYGRMADDRLVIPDSTLENPNDLGFAILFVMSGLLVFQSKITRLLAAASMPVFIYYLLKTGSRADLITLIALAAVAFYYAPRNWKMMILVAAPLVGAGAVALVPGQTLARLATIFDSSKGAQNLELQGAMDSQAARAQLQRRAIELTLKHPLFGVGVTNFEDAVDEMVQKAIGEKSGWQVAHNTYLQVSAENGIPAFILYVWSLILCLKMNYWSYKTCRETPQLSTAMTQSLALILMTCMFIICTAFSNNSCDPHLGVLIGLSAANYLAVQRELKAAQLETAPNSGIAQAPWTFPRRPAPALQTPRPASGRFPLPAREPGQAQIFARPPRPA
jgi:O-Antigen ligase